MEISFFKSPNDTHKLMVDRGCDASVDLSDIMNWDIDKVATFYVKHASVMHINVLHMTSVIPIFQN